jgi:uncharacterized repeat protein (TIGR02543 family)
MKKILLSAMWVAAALLTPQAAMAQVNPDFEGRAKLAMDAFKAYTAEGQNARMGAIAAAARLKANNGNDQAMINYIASYYDNRKPGEPGYWPSLSSVAWVVGKYRDKFTPTQLNNLKTKVKGLSNLVSSGTENHTLNYQVAGYLFAQHWPNETGWHGGRTSTQLMDATRANLRNIVSSLYSKGYNEDLSTTYVATHLSPYFILYDCASDPEMKKIADAAITFHVSHIAASHFEGVVLPPFNRQNAPQFNKHNGGSWNPVLQWTYWLYWGEVQNRVPTTSNFRTNGENRWFIHAALSDWRPPAAINSLAFGRTVPYELTSTKPNFEHFGAGGAGEYERYVYRDRLFAMGSGNMRFRPNGVQHDYNMSGLIYKSPDTFNYIDFHQDYWRSNNRIWSGASPFIQMAQHKGTAIVLFNIPATDPWRERGPEEYQILRNNYYDKLIQEGMVRYPKAIDQKVEAGGWIFLREGDVYIAIRPLKAYTIDGSYNNTMVKYPSDSDESHLNSFVDTMAQFNVVRSAHAQTGFVLDVATKGRFASFEAFQTAVRQNTPTVNWSNLSVSYKNVEGNTLSSTWKAPQPDYKDVPSSYGNSINAQVWVRPTYSVNGTVVPLDTDFTGAKAVIKSNSIRLVGRVLQLTTPEGNLSVNWSSSSPVFSNATSSTYSVTYNANGATSGTAPATQTKTHNVALTLATNSGNLARTGYTFAGWNTAANGSGTNYAAGASYTGNANLSLFARWTANSYTVTYNANGATSGTAPATQTKTHDVALTLATNSGNLVRTGFTFAGWNTSAVGSGTNYAAGASYTGNANLSLFARWTANTYSVTYNANGATSGTAPATQTKTHDVALTLATNSGNLARNGFTFAGWNTLADGSGINYAVGATYTGNANLSLFARWTAVATYSVTYNANGATSGAAPANQTKTHDMALTLATNSGNLARTGFTFAGWNTSADGSGANFAAGATYTGNANLSLFARWTANTYTITYNANSATSGSAPASQTKTHDVALTLAANSGNLVRTGYTFAGWNTAADGTGTNFATGGSYTGNANLSLFARWTANTYTITYNANSATSGTAPASQTKTHDVALTLAANSGNLARTGFTFAGWNTSADGSGTNYAAGASYTGNADLSLFARWTASTYTVTYNANSATSGTAPASQTKTHDVSLTLAANSGNLARTGYTFAGWNTSADGSGTDYAAGASYTGNADLSLFARWTASTYTVTYSANSANSGTAPASQTKTHDVSLTLAANSGNLARTGFTFAGWNTSADGSGTDYTAGASYTGNADLSLFARWTASTYTVTYNANSATSGTAPASQTKTHDVSLTLAANSGNLARTGFTFAGWNTSADGSGTDYTSGASYTGNADLALFAKWTTVTAGVVEFTETFDTATTAATNGWTGSGNTASNNNYGWANTDVVLGSGTGGAAGGIIARTISFNHFADTSIVTLNRTDSSRLAGSFRLTNSNFDGAFYLGYFTPGQGISNFIGIQISEPSGSAGDPFRGYVRVAGTGGAGTDIISLAQNTILTFDLVWTGSADGSGTLSGTLAGQSVNIPVAAGEGSFSAFGLLSGGAVSNSTQRTAGCYFDSLSYNKGGPTPPVTYTVTYDANGATSGTVPATQTKTKDLDLTLADNSGNLTRPGYSFAGWNTAADGSGMNYAAGATYTGNADLALFSKWTDLGSTWNLASGGGWGTAGNWNPSGVPGGINSVVNFTNNITGSASINLNGSRTVGTINIGDLNGTHNFNINSSSGNILTFEVSSGSAALNLTSTHSLATNLTTNISTINSIRLGSDLVLSNHSPTGGIIIQVPITESNGERTLTLAGAGGTGLNTFSRPNGFSRLVVRDNMIFNNFNAIVNGSVDDLAYGKLPAAFMSDAITLSGGGGLRAGGDAIYRISANRGITLGAGGGRFLVLTTGRHFVIDSVIAGAAGGGLTLQGSGSVTLNAANTYDGDTAVNGSTLILGHASAIPGTSKLVLGNGGKVSPSGNTVTVGSLFFGDVQQASGTWGATGSGATNINDTYFTGTGMVSVTGGSESTTNTPLFEQWAGGPVMDFGGDDNGDGISNGMAFLLGTTGPEHDAHHLLPAAAWTNEGLTLSFKMLDVEGRGNASLSVEYSSDLVNWTTVPMPETSGESADGVLFDISNSGVHDVKVTIPSGKAAGGKLYARLRADQ